MKRANVAPSQYHNLTILSTVMGLKNYGTRYDHITKGLVHSRVYVNGLDATFGNWTQQPGVRGEIERVC